MTAECNARLGFISAMGQAFCESVSPPVPFDAASPHECCQPIWAVLGSEVTPDHLASIPERGLLQLAVAFGEWFECEPPTVIQITQAIEATLFRWPKGSLDLG